MHNTAQPIKSSFLTLHHYFLMCTATTHGKTYLSSLICIKGIIYNKIRTINTTLPTTVH